MAFCHSASPPCITFGWLQNNRLSVVVTTPPERFVAFRRGAKHPLTSNPSCHLDKLLP